MKKELDILSKALKNLSSEEMDILLDSIYEENRVAKSSTKKSRTKQSKTINYDEIDEDPKIVAASKLMNKNKKKAPSRPAVKEITVRCLNCNKEWDLPENYPGIKNFVCCVRK